MKVTHEFTIAAVCPVNDQLDLYSATLVLVDEVLPVETIIAEVGKFEGVAIFQEDVTVRLGAIFGGTLTTVGTHSGIMTTVTVS